MIPHYTTKHQYCEWCDGLILIGDEAVLTTDGYFCNDECLKDHLYEMSWKQGVYLTRDKIYRSVD